MKRIPLDGDWKLQNASESGVFHPGVINYATDGWIDAKVPGTVQQAYLDSGILPHPFIEENAKLWSSLERDTFWYRKEIFLPRDFAGEKYTLDFEGLDTFATIYFNGKEIGQTENAFVPYSFDVTPYLAPGDFNVVTVKIESSISRVDKKVQDFRKMGYTNIFGSDDMSRVYLRRPQVSFGWDFAPRLVNAGIWRSVYLTAHSSVSIQSVFSKTIEIGKNTATVEFDISMEKNIPGAVECEIEITISKGSSRIQKKVPYRLKPSQRSLSERIQMVINKPQLWFPHTIGKPALYNVEIQLVNNKKVMDSSHHRLGIRKVEVIQDVAGEKRFTFVVNGIPVFCKGANWVPADAITTDAAPAKYQLLLTKAREGNLNMLRIWGGGIFEHDLFYDLCDEFGIMVWQDFMFACAMYPDHDPGFMSNVEQETRKAVTRLRNHPSLVLWCGNNENQMGWFSWGWNKLVPRHHGEKIYHDLLPGICAELDPTRLYHPGSPFGGKDPNSYEEGDCHDWRIWHQQLPYKAFDDNTSRFVSEYGLQGAPQLDTVKKYLKKEHLWPLNPTWEFHHLKIDYMKPYLDEFGTPQSAEDYVRLTQMAQAHTYKFAIESFRNRMPQCSGSLFWQWNDPWPTTCWSVIDYYHKPKMAYFWSKKAYQNVYPVLKKTKNGEIEAWVINDTVKKISAKFELILDAFNGKYSDKYVMDVTIAPCTSQKVLENALSYFKLKNPKTEVLRARLIFNHQETDNAFYFVPLVEQQLGKAKITAWKKTGKKETQVILKSETLVRMVELKTSDGDHWFSDNYFDLYPGESKMVTIPSSQPLKIFIQGFNSGQVVV